MADTVEYYKSILHEQRRADYFGKTNYKANLSTERARLESENPAFVGEDCNCSECQSGVFAQ